MTDYIDTSEMGETSIMNLVMVALSAKFGALVLRANAGTFRALKTEQIVRGAPAGTSDLVACINGRFFAIEVKTEAGRQSPKQKKFETAVLKRGGVYLLVGSPEDAVAQVAAALESRPQAG